MNQNLGEGICNIENCQALESEIRKLLRQLLVDILSKDMNRHLTEEETCPILLVIMEMPITTKMRFHFIFVNYEKKCNNKNCCIRNGSMRTLIHSFVPSILEKQLSICIPNNSEILCIIIYNKFL